MLKEQSISKTYAFTTLLLEAGGTVTLSEKVERISDVRAKYAGDILCTSGFIGL